MKLLKNVEFYCENCGRTWVTCSKTDTNPCIVCKQILRARP